jgi:predicted transposase/invertase (TIGR01784 family)
VFGSEGKPDITKSFLNSVLAHAGLRKIVSLSILNPYRPGPFRGDRDAILDVRAIDESEREFQLEIQVRPYAALPRRMLHNWASCYLSGLRKGQGYENLRPIVSIWLLERDLFAEGPWFRNFALREEIGGKILCEDQRIILIELESWASQASGAIEAIPGLGAIADPLDRWLYFLSRGEEFDPARPPEALRGEEYLEAMEIMAAFTKSEAARDLYRRRLEYRLEQGSIAYEERHLREKALAEGRAEGRAEGITEGERKKALESARKLKQRGVEHQIIAEATGLTLEEVVGI